MNGKVSAGPDFEARSAPPLGGFNLTLLAIEVPCAPSSVRIMLSS